MPSAQTIPLEQTPYVPQSTNSSSTTGPGASTISALQKYDVYAKLDFKPRRDLVNGTAPVGDSDWHTGANDLGTPGQPYFIANGYEPKYLNSQHGPCNTDIKYRDTTAFKRDPTYEAVINMLGITPITHW
jgi:hypothetical protein